jgi:hypothetical protein
MSAERQLINGRLPLLVPKPCPICGAKVFITCITEWESDTGTIVGYEYECETEPDIDSDDWESWFDGHYSMPYVDWLPWQVSVDKWLANCFFYRWESVA